MVGDITHDDLYSLPALHNIQLYMDQMDKCFTGLN